MVMTHALLTLVDISRTVKQIILEIIFGFLQMKDKRKDADSIILSPFLVLFGRIIDELNICGVRLTAKI